MIKPLLHFIKRFVQMVLVPPHCSFCKIMMEQDFPLCDECLSNIRRLVPTDIQLTPTKKMTVFALGAYEDALAALVRAKQHRNIGAAHQLGVLLAEHIRVWNLPIDYLVAVPLHWRRYAWRGFNQAEVIATEIAQLRKTELVPIVRRTKHTAYQMTQSAKERVTNVKDVFSLSVQESAQYRGKHILVVDDLMTTGATLEAVGRALLPLKPASITALVACRVV